MTETNGVNKQYSHLDIVVASIKVFSNDGKLDLAELDQLLALALRDRNLDPEEKRVLARIFAEAEKGTLSADVARRIADIRRQHVIPT
ncbi:MAG: hypothetical protein AB7V26_10475 [Lysobacterales bacterium]